MKTSILSDNIKSILAVLIVTAVLGYFYMCSIRDIKPDPQITIAMVGALGTVLGYFFGSSSGSKDKPTVTQTGDQPQVTVNPAPEGTTI